MNSILGSVVPLAMFKKKTGAVHHFSWFIIQSGRGEMRAHLVRNLQLVWVQPPSSLQIWYSSWLRWSSWSSWSSWSKLSSCSKLSSWSRFFIMVTNAIMVMVKIAIMVDTNIILVRVTMVNWSSWSTWSPGQTGQPGQTGKTSQREQTRQADLNLTFQVTCEGKLSQFLQCFIRVQFLIEEMVAYLRLRPIMNNGISWILLSMSSCKFIIPKTDMCPYIHI